MIQIRSIDRPLFPGGTWVAGTVGEFQFNALVFREHAVKPEFELYDWLQVEVDWDCGRSLMLSVPLDRVERLSLPEPDA